MNNYAVYWRLADRLAWNLLPTAFNCEFIPAMRAAMDLLKSEQVQALARDMEAAIIQLPPGGFPAMFMSDISITAQAKARLRVNDFDIQVSNA